MIKVILLMLLTMPALAKQAEVSFGQVENATSYKVYDVTGGSKIEIGSGPTSPIIVEIDNAAASGSIIIIGSNASGEGPPSNVATWTDYPVIEVPGKITGILIKFIE